MLFKKEKLIEFMKPGSVLLDHTTSSPSLARAIYQAAKERSILTVDAPVSGGDIGAKNGKLVSMVGGEKEAVEAVMPVLKCYSANIAHMGGPGKGQETKMVNQIMISGAMVAMCEGLVAGHKCGLDLT